MHTTIVAPCTKTAKRTGFAHADRQASKNQNCKAITKLQTMPHRNDARQIDHLSHSQQCDLVNLPCPRRLCHCQTCTPKTTQHANACRYIHSINMQDGMMHRCNEMNGNAQAATHGAATWATQPSPQGAPRNIRVVIPSATWSPEVQSACHGRGTQRIVEC